MHTYIWVVKQAVFFFPLIAFLITIPYMLHNYHKYGSVILAKTVIVYSFILYLLCAYFLVILPLPSRESVLRMTSPRMQLIPLHFIQDVLSEAHKLSGYARFLRNPAVFQFLFNVLMLAPFGMYLHYYFRCSLSRTVLFSFLLSFFFELTQLSGLYFYYPRSYRLFDVDDLLANTLGGLLGYACVIPLEKILPSRDRLDEQSISKGMRVSLTRRVTSTLLDLLWCNIVTMLLTGIVRYLTKKVLWYLPVYFFIYALWSWYRKGVPFGKRLTRLRLVTMDNTEVKWYQYFLRYGLLYGFLKLPEGITWMIDTWIPLSSTYQMIARVLVWIGCFLWGITCLVKVAFHESLLYERGSRTKVVSTIEKSEKE